MNSRRTGSARSGSSRSTSSSADAAAPFTGFGAGLVAFYEALERNNSRAWFAENKGRYESEVLRPLQALARAVEPTYGAAKIFRPYRDVRFSSDKRPIKEQAAMWLDRGDGTGYYLQVSADGLLLGGGMHQPPKPTLAAFRARVDSEAGVKQIRRILSAAQRHSVLLSEDFRLATVPRGYPKDHPSADLLGLTSLILVRHFPPGAWMSTKAATAKITDTWNAMTAWNALIASL